MKVTEFSAEGFRNLQAFSIRPHSRMNVIYGENAQGKTNLIEGIWLFSGEKSFRGAKDGEMAAFGAQKAALFLSFSDSEREQSAEIRLLPQKKATLNGVAQKSVSALTGRFYCVVFAPTHLSLVKDGPNKRRRFLDLAIAQTSPKYLYYAGKYERVLIQRNALLRQMSRYSDARATLGVWDEQLAKLGTILTIYRGDYVKKLAPAAAQIYSGIASQREALSTVYQSTAFADPAKVTRYTDDAIGEYLAALEDGLEQDLRQGMTTVGVHRDDLEIQIDGRPARNFGSQGQQRSAALSLKLAEAAILKAVCGEEPVVLLDDVMSELDAGRQAYILNHIRSHQVFLTCCEKSRAALDGDGVVWHIENGKIQPESAFA